MNTSPETIAQVIAIGVGATVVMDLWLQVLQRLGIKTLNFAMVGRWVGHWRRGVFSHEAIAKAQPVRGEVALGWAFHYTTGVLFAGVLVLAAGAAWIRNPSLFPALGVGLATVIAPWFVMQPAMGAGIASSRSAAPLEDRVRSVANHTVFGLGLYLAALLVSRLS